MVKVSSRRIQVLLVSNDPEFLERWLDLCACHHCSTFHVAPRLDGNFRNLKEMDFDIAILSLDSPEELGSALEYLEEVSPDCVVIPCRPRTKTPEEAPIHDLARKGAIASLPAPTGDEEAFVLALNQARLIKDLNFSAAA